MRAKLSRAALAALAAVVAAAVPASWADQRLETEVGISLRPIQSDGGTRYYRVAGRPEPVFWDPVLPIVKGDVLEVRVLPTSGERPLSLCQIRLNGRAIETFRSLPPYEAAVDTANLAEGWHLIEAFCQQADSHPMRASGSVRFLLVKSLDEPAAEERTRALEQLRVQLAQEALKRQQEWEAEVARLSADQADKERRHQQALAAARADQEEAARLRQQVSQMGADLTQAIAQVQDLTVQLGKARAAPAAPQPAPTRTVSAQIRVRGGAAGERVVLLFKQGEKVLLEKQYQLFANGSLLLPVQLPADVRVFVVWANGRVTAANVQPVANTKEVK